MGRRRCNCTGATNAGASAASICRTRHAFVRPLRSCKHADSESEVRLTVSLHLEDLKACIGAETVMQVAATVADLGFDGAPDLVLYRPGTLWFVEVKSATDNLREAQVGDGQSA